MSNDEQYTCDQCQDLLADIIDNSVNPLQKQYIDQHLRYCDPCNTTIQQLWEMQSLSTRWQDESVPRWSHRESFFGQYQWWPKIQFASTFASLFILIAVLGDAQISTRNGFEISFGGQNYLTQSELENKIAVLESQLANQQQAQLQAKVANLSERQVATNQLLLKTLLERSRAERREDLNTLVSNWYVAQDQQTEQTNESIRALLVNQVEDRRNIKQLNKLLRTASQKGTAL